MTEDRQQEVKIVVDQQRERSLLAAGAGAGLCVKCAPILIILLLISTLGASGAAGVFLSRMLGLEDQVDRLEGENDRLEASNDEYERLNQQFRSQLDVLERENANFRANNEEFARQLEVQEELNESLQNTTNDLREQVDKLEIVATYINQSAVENNAKFNDLLTELATTINSSRSQQDSVYSMLMNTVVLRVPNILTPIYTPYSFFQSNQAMGTFFDDIFQQTMNVLSEICVNADDLTGWLSKNTTLAPFNVAEPAAMKFTQYISAINRYGNEMRRYYFTDSGIEWYQYAHTCSKLPPNLTFRLL